MSEMGMDVRVKPSRIPRLSGLFQCFIEINNSDLPPLPILLFLPSLTNTKDSLTVLDIPFVGYRLRLVCSHFLMKLRRGNEDDREGAGIVCYSVW